MKGQKYTEEQVLQLAKHCYAVGEPIFIIRGQDALSWKIIKAYSEMLKDSIGPEKAEEPGYVLAEGAEKFAAEVLEWQGLNYEKIKLPD